MNSKAILSFAAVAAFATLAALASTAASANDGDTYQVAVNAQGSRDRAQVQAEARTEAAIVRTNSSYEGDPSPVAALHSGLDAKTVRAEAAQAVRLGQIRSGEIAQ
jgi:hypothetical protein